MKWNQRASQRGDLGNIQGAAFLSSLAPIDALRIVESAFATAVGTALDESKLAVLSEYHKYQQFIWLARQSVLAGVEPRLAEWKSILEEYKGSRGSVTV